MSVRVPIALLISAFLYSRNVVADTCSSVASANPEVLIYGPASAQYTVANNEYWSTGCAALKPTCIICPRNPKEVVSILDILHQNNETFAIKSGGHNPNKYFASVQGGPLISLEEVKEIEYQPETETVRVGSGARWQDVILELETVERVVVGGRMGHVGVGGYLLGGGLSFLSSQYGWASTQVVQYDLVLPNGTITQATSEMNADLFKALQTGGSSFGIVTTFTLRTFPHDHQVWGGTITFWQGQTPQILAAVRDFTEHYPDPKAAIIATAEITLFGAASPWILFLFYDGPTPPANVFANFTSIPYVVADVRTRSYLDLLQYNNNFILKGSIYTIGTETTPLPSKARGKEVMESYHKHWADTAGNVSSVLGSIASVAYQPLPKLISTQTQKYGGNLMDFGDDVDRIVMEFDYSYLFAWDDRTVERATQLLYGGMGDLVTKFIGEGKLEDAYRPLFMNDAYLKQDFWARLKDGEWAKRVAESVDPERFLPKRMAGGFFL